MCRIRLAVILLLLSALPAGLAAQAGTVQLSSNEGAAALSDTALLLICGFGAAGAWLLRRPSRASGEDREKEGGTPEDPRPPSMTETARR